MKEKLRVAMLCASILLSSCAYVQTHKNVEERGVHYEGKVLSKESIDLHRKDGLWYLSARRAKFRLEYPTVHDEVFRKNMTSPSFKLIDLEPDVMYHPISAQTAEILQRSDGYFSLNALANDMQSTSGQWLPELPGAQRYTIRAEIAGSHKYYIRQNRVPEKTPPTDEVLSALDFVVVDIPATVLYNLAIPFMAPFVFFYEFSQSD